MIAELEGALDLDRRTDGIGGTREHDHEAVTEVLHLAAAVGLDRRTEEREMVAAQLLRRGLPRLGT